MRKKLFTLTIMLLALLFAPLASSAETLLVNDGTTTTSYLPIYGSYCDTEGTHTQVIYPANLLTDMVGKSITQLEFTSNTASQNFDFTATFVVSLGTTTETAFNTSSPAFDQSALTMVYTGQLSVKNSVFAIEFGTDFPYTGGNLLLDIVVATAGNYTSVPFKGVSSTGAGVYQYGTSAARAVSTAPRTNFYYETPASCAKPYGITLGEVTSNTAAISWTPGASETAWKFCYSVNGSAIDTVDVTGTPSYTVTNLTPASEITLSGYVLADCGTEVSNARNFNFSFLTECVARTNPLFVEGFESTVFPPICWSMDWITPPTSGSQTPFKRSTTSTYIHSGAASCGGSTSVGAVQALSTDILPIDSANKYEVVFWMYRKASSTANLVEGLKIFASPTPNDTTNATLIGYVHTPYNLAPAEASTGVYKYNFPITVAGNYHLVFVGINESSSPAYFDDVQVRRIPTCLDIQGVQTFSDITTFTAVVSVSDSSVTSFDVAYGLQGTPVDQCQIATSTGMSVTLTGLQPSEFYDTYIRRNCGNDLGEWTVIPETFRTLCLPVSAMPFTEDFEGEPTGWLAGCYTTTSTNSYFPGVVSNASYNHTEGGIKGIGNMYAATGTSGTSIQGTTGIYRQFDLDASKFYKISAWSKDYGASYSHNIIYVCDTVISSDMPVMATCPVVGTDWTECVGYLQVPATGTYFIGFQGSNPTASFYFYIDDIRIEEVSCIPPVGIAVENVAEHSAEVVYSSTAPIVQMALGTDEATLFSNVETITASPYALTNLADHTTYYVALRTINGTDTSVWSSVVSFMTLCEPVHDNQFPFVEDFENEPTGFLEGCYTWINSGSYNTMVFAQERSNHTEEGSKGIGLGYSSTSTSSASQSYKNGVFRRFDLVAGQYYAIGAWAKNYDNTYTDYSYDLTFVYGTDCSLDSMTEIRTLRVSDFAWKEYTGYFEAPATGTYYLGFTTDNGGNSYYMFIDDIEIYKVYIIPPTTYSVENIAQTTADLVFTATAPQTEVRMSTEEANVLDGDAYYNTNVTASPLQLTGLTSNTAYYYALRSIEDMDTSDWVYGNFRTLCYPVSSFPWIDDFESFEEDKAIGGCYTNLYLDDTNDDLFIATEDRYASNDESLLCAAVNSGSAARGNYALFRDFTLSASESYKFSVDAVSQASSSYSPTVKYGFYIDFIYGTVPDVDSMEVFGTKIVDTQGIYANFGGYLTVPADGNYYVGVRLRPLQTSSYMYIDNFAAETVTCVPPTHAKVTAVSPTTATFDFGAANTYELAVDSFELYFYEDGEIEEPSLYLDTMTAAGYTMTGLEPNTTYYLSMRTVCSDDDMSEWIDVLTFTTPCAAGSSLPFYEDFESYTTAANTIYVFNDCQYFETPDLYYPAVSQDLGGRANHTPNGVNGLTSGQNQNGTYKANMVTGDFAYYNYFALEAGKTYEYSVWARYYQNARLYNLDVVYGQTASFSDMTVAANMYVDNDPFVELRANITVPADGDYFVGVHTYGNPGSAYYPVLDDIRFKEIVVAAEYYDTICGGEGYVLNGFNIAASEIAEGANRFELRDSGEVADTLTVLYLYAYPVVEPSVEYVTYCDNELPADLQGYEPGEYMLVDTLVAASGCDSVATRYVTVNASYLFTDSVTVDFGESYEWQGMTLTEPDIYIMEYTTEQGCDSSYMIKFDVKSGVENVSGVRVDVVPNPVRPGMTAHVYGDFGEVESVEILNNLGQVVDAFVPASYPVEVKSIETEGLYFVRIITSDGNIYTEKLLVK